MTECTPPDTRINFDDKQYVRRRKIRRFKDKIARFTIGLGGISVIVAILLIFVYLLSEVIPMLRGASIAQRSEFAVPSLESGESLLISIEEQTEIGLRLTNQGKAVFFNTEDGALVDLKELILPENTSITSSASDAPSTRMFALGLDNGQAILAKHQYQISWPKDQRLITPQIEYPFGHEALIIAQPAQPLKKVVVRDQEEALLVGAVTQAGKVLLTRFSKITSFLSEEVTLEREELTIAQPTGEVTALAIDSGQEWFYVLTEQNQLHIYRLAYDGLPEKHSLVELGTQARVLEMEFLLGELSLLMGDDQGRVSQWFLVRGEANNWSLQKIRSFDSGASGVRHIVAEHRRKGFVTLNGSGELGLFNTTASRDLLREKISEAAISHASLAPRSNALLLENEKGRMQVLDLENEHPEVSWSVLWEKVWYESYEKPEYIWQSSAASNDFEPKLSLMPLAFGTIKAAFYAMLLATPLAICGAIFTAYFMAPGMRRKVKPLIELMEALPTVILGFLAGLWLAPFVEMNLPGIFCLFIITPIAILALSFAWFHLPRSLRNWLPEGSQVTLLIPLIMLVGWISISLSSATEQIFFGGDMRHWLSSVVGVNFDQRNSLVVGLAMGFAIIPTIFSITEDAIFSVPKHLTNGSLALGATQWQTLTRVVILTASPGIFSAVMIGFGRAVGETMIVLMATGNTPIMDWNIFEGMRTMAANIAVEMPESEVGSTHYRVLFLAALVLFLFTFVFNTIAEIVRDRLRRRYGSL